MIGFYPRHVTVSTVLGAWWLNRIPFLIGAPMVGSHVFTVCSKSYRAKVAGLKRLLSTPLGNDPGVWVAIRIVSSTLNDGPIGLGGGSDK